MNRKFILVAVALFGATTATAGGAHAFERSGSADISVGDRGVHHEFRTTFDPDTLRFTRSGTLDFMRGGRAAYEVAGTCKPGGACNWTGAGKGPMGGTWTGNGTLERDDDAGFVVEGRLTSPRRRDRIFPRHRR